MVSVRVDGIRFEFKPVREMPPARQGILESYSEGSQAKVMGGEPIEVDGKRF